MVIRGRVTRPQVRRAKPGRSGRQSRSLELEAQLSTELRSYITDVPEDAFPTFLEALYFDSFKGELKWTT